MIEPISHRVASKGFDDDADDLVVAPLTRAEAQDLRRRKPQVSPWRVVAAQVLVGCLSAAAVWWVWGRPEFVGSALYGALVAVLPGALMARGMTSKVSSRSVVSSALSVMLWSAIKVGVSLALLALAPRLVQPLNWPVLLATLMLCLQMYWIALLWRGR